MVTWYARSLQDQPLTAIATPVWSDDRRTRQSLRGGARHDPLLPDVVDDSGRRGEVGILVQDREVMVQCGSHDQVISH